MVFKYYYEKCDKKYMMSHLNIIPKIQYIQNIIPKHPYSKIKKLLRHNHLSRNINSSLSYYILSNIIWSDNLIDNIQSNNVYPSKYFINIISVLIINEDYIVNPPLIIDQSMINNYKYIILQRNKTLIIDALLNQGSVPRYINKVNNEEKYLYSEHSGVLVVKDCNIENIIISTESNRIDDNDQEIFLPKNTLILKQHEYIFHTHPNTNTYAGRVKNGILYEFPSANDIFNFVMCHNKGKAQSAIVFTPEGIYVIRPLVYTKYIDIDYNLYDEFNNFILYLEDLAINKFEKYLSKIIDPDLFHKYISPDYTFIKLFNKFLRKYNIFIEYYPREKKNNEWTLPQIFLFFIKS